jgi:hypothetical protein
MIKKTLVQVICCFAVIYVLYLVIDSIIVVGIIGLILLLLVMIKPAFFILNKLTQRSNWYKNQLADGLKFCKQIPRNLDICNLGSNSGKYSFDYDDTGLIGENWALGPQTLSYDFRVLKNYFSYLKGGATVIILLCPFSSCIKDFEDDSYNYKYYSFLNPVLIRNYSRDTKKKVMNFVNAPFQDSPFTSIKRLIKDVPAISNIMLSTETMDEESLKNDACVYIDNWEKQFIISDLDGTVSSNNLESIEYNSHLLQDMISFCLERKLTPVIVLPPMTKALSSRLSGIFRENYIYSFIRSANTKQVPFIDYSDDERFDFPDLYYNSYLLNFKGRKLFTNTVLKDLGLIK